MSGKRYSKVISRKTEMAISKTDAIEALFTALEMAKGVPITEQDLISFVKSEKELRRGKT